MWANENVISFALDGDFGMGSLQLYFQQTFVEFSLSVFESWLFSKKKTKPKLVILLGNEKRARNLRNIALMDYRQLEVDPGANKNCINGYRKTDSSSMFSPLQIINCFNIYFLPFL